MVIRKLQKKDITDAQKLWMESFGDSEDFVHFYFENKFNPENSMAAFINNTLVGDITMQEFDLKIRNRVLRTGFLAGCATKTEFRGQGIMKDLLQAQLAEMNKKGYAFCHLHPFLHAFYRKFGWETVSFMYKTVAMANSAEISAKENVFNDDMLIVLYNRFVDKFDGFFMRSPAEMSVRIREHIIDGGKVVCSGGGYAIYFVLEDMVDVIELVAQSDADLEEIKSMLCSYGLPVSYYMPDASPLTKGGEMEEYTMMRVVNAHRALESISMPDMRFTIGVRDDFCEWNNVTLLVEYKDGLAKVREYTGAEPDARVDIRELTQLLAGKYDGKNSILKGFFTEQKTCFFNTY